MTLDIIEKEKSTAIALIHAILKELNQDFTWKVVEIAISFNDRLGKDNPLVVKSFEGILSEELKNKLEEYLPECTDNGMSASDIISEMINSSSHPDFAKINASLANASIPFNSEIQEECQAWDKDEQTIQTEVFKDDKARAIMQIKMKLHELVMLKGFMSEKGECYGDECIAEC